MNETADENEVLTPQEVTQVFKISRRTLWAWDAKGLLRPIKINRRVIRYRKADVAALILRG